MASLRYAPLGSVELAINCGNKSVERFPITQRPLVVPQLTRTCRRPEGKPATEERGISAEDLYAPFTEDRPLGDPHLQLAARRLVPTVPQPGRSPSPCPTGASSPPSGGGSQVKNV